MVSGGYATFFHCIRRLSDYPFFPISDDKTFVGRGHPASQQVVEFVADDVVGDTERTDGRTATLAADGNVQRTAVGAALTVGDGKHHGLASAR